MLNSTVQFLFLAIIVGIPFYFLHWTQNNRSLAAREINTRASKLCIAELALLLITSFLSTAQKTESTTKIMFGAVFLSIMLLFSFRSQATQKLRKIELSHKDRFIGSFRSFAAISLTLGLNYGAVYALAPFIGTFAAVAVAIALIISVAPLMVRILYSCNPMHPSPLKDNILAVFKSAGVNLHEIYLMDTHKTKVSNALVCGSKFGFGPMKRSLFLTENLFEVLNEEELKAVICHEASHFQLHHVAKRGFSALALFVLALIVVSAPIAMIMMLVESQTWLTTLVLVSIACNIFFQFAFIFRVIRKHEFEADLNAVTLGANPEALISSLEKITEFNGGSQTKEPLLTRMMMGSGHPTLDERRDAIRSYQMPKSARILPEMRFIASYVAIVLVIGTCFLNAKKPTTSALQREIASETQKSAQ